MNNKQRIAIGLLSVSALGFGSWKAHEGFTSTAIIPTKGDVPTLGHGSTRYEDGSRVKMGDTITRQRASELARNLMREDERKFAASLPPTVTLTQAEYDVYLDFAGQYGIGNWRQSSMRANVAAGQYRAACDSLLKYRFAAGYDCSTLVNGKPNKRCWGVWTRQRDRHQKCTGAL